MKNETEKEYSLNNQIMHIKKSALVLPPFSFPPTMTTSLLAIFQVFFFLRFLHNGAQPVNNKVGNGIEIKALSLRRDRKNVT